jgi:hypothetical protein
MMNLLSPCFLDGDAVDQGLELSAEVHRAISGWTQNDSRLLLELRTVIARAEAEVRPSVDGVASGVTHLVRYESTRLIVLHAVSYFCITDSVKPCKAISRLRSS